MVMMMLRLTMMNDCPLSFFIHLYINYHIYNPKQLLLLYDVQPSVGKLVLPESTVMYIKQNKVKDMQLKKGGH